MSTGGPMLQLWVGSFLNQIYPWSGNTVSFWSKGNNSNMVHLPVDGVLQGLT